MSESASNTASRRAAVRTGPAGPEAAAQDAALVARCRGGDTAAFAVLVAKYQDRIFNVIYRMTGNRSDAEELSQETFLRALQKLSQFAGRSGFYTWLFRVAVNLTLSHRRRRGRAAMRSLNGPSGPAGEDCEPAAALLADHREAEPHAAADAEETNRRVAEALGELEEEFRVVVILRDIEDMDYEAIGQVLDVPIGTVKSRLHRGRQALRRMLPDLVEP